MIRYLLVAPALIAIPSFGQTVTSATRLSGSDDGRVVVGKAVTTPSSKKGAVLFDCGSTIAPFVHVVGHMGNCPKGTAIQSPVVTSKPKDFGGSGQVAYGSARNIHALRAMAAFPLRQAASPIIIRDVIADGVRDFVTPDKAGTTINDVTIERVEAKVAKRGIYIRGDSTNWAIRDFRFTGSAPRTDSSIPVGIAINGTAHDILIERGYLANFRTNWSADKYANGDCISTERGNVNIKISKVVCEGSSDGGFDLKSSSTRLDDLSVTDAGHYSYRLWAQGTAGTLTSINPGIAHVQAASLTTDWVIDKLIAIGGRPLVSFDKAGGKIDVRSCDLSRWTGTEKVKGNGAVTFGATCLGSVKR